MRTRHLWCDLSCLRDPVMNKMFSEITVRVLFKSDTLSHTVSRQDVLASTPPGRMTPRRLCTRLSCVTDAREPPPRQTFLRCVTRLAR